MHTYRATGPVFLHDGVVGIGRDQAKTRTHALEPIGRDRYRILQRVCFKRGEQFAYEGQVTKAMLQNMEPIQVGKKSGTEQVET